MHLDIAFGGLAINLACPNCLGGGRCYSRGGEERGGEGVMYSATSTAHKPVPVPTSRILSGDPVIGALNILPSSIRVQIR